MTEIISVRFKDGGKSYYFNPNGLTVAPGEQIIIETSRGVEFGTCVEGNHLIDEMQLVSPLRPVVRKATENDCKLLEQNREKEAKAYDICLQKIQEHGLDMKLVEVEYNFDGSKILFFFTSEGRVDFRALVRDLASIFHTRIELRQIGVRDEAKMLGGLGVCGRPYCCNAFLEDFHPVSIKMAKTQNLSLNPTKISGACGRLMCCLKYEQEAYEDVLKRTPKLESLVETPDGVGTVNAVQLLREKVKVRLDNDPENPQIYSNDEIRVIRSGKGKRPEGYELPDPAEAPAKQPQQPTRLRPTAPAAPAKNAASAPTAPRLADHLERPAKPERKAPETANRAKEREKEKEKKPAATVQPDPEELELAQLEQQADRHSASRRHRNRPRKRSSQGRKPEVEESRGEERAKQAKRESSAAKPQNKPRPQKQESTERPRGTGSANARRKRRPRPNRGKSNEGGNSAPTGE
jgi:cell fate regulator YaaT (PSP1 superfamily)